MPLQPLTWTEWHNLYLDAVDTSGIRGVLTEDELRMYHRHGFTPEETAYRNTLLSK